MTTVLSARLRTVSISFATTFATSLATASAVALTGGLVGAAVTAVPAAAADTATLSVLHALPGLTADIYVDGKRAVDDLEPGQLAGPIALTAGAHRVLAVKSTAPNGDVPGIELTGELAADGSYTAVIYRSPDNRRTGKLFRNDVSATPAGEGRLTVRHVAAAAPVDVTADDAIVAKDLGGSEQTSVELPAGRVAAAVSLTGTRTTIIDPVEVGITAGATTVAYVWGNTRINSQTLAVQTVQAGASAPSAVDAGETGEAAGVGGVGGTSAVAALVAAGLGALVLVRRVRRHRRTTVLTARPR